jgi:hypothetical protein
LTCIAHPEGKQMRDIHENYSTYIVNNRIWKRETIKQQIKGNNEEDKEE